MDRKAKMQLTSGAMAAEGAASSSGSGSGAEKAGSASRSGVLGGIVEAGSDFMENMVNATERAAGRDLDGDGDIGVKGRAPA